MALVPNQSNIGVGTVSFDDIKVKVSGTDTTTGFLDDKIISGDASITIAVSGGGGDEKLDIRSTGGGITDLNGEVGTTQSFATGTSGTDFNISSAANTHTFNIPDFAGNGTRGLVPDPTAESGLFLRDDGAWASAGADGNGIYDGSGSLSGATVVTMATNDFTWGSTGDASLMKFDTTNNRIGIGEGTPLYKCHVDHSSGFGTIFIEKNGGDAAFRIDNGASQYVYIGDGGTQDGAAAILYSDAGAERCRITSSTNQSSHINTRFGINVGNLPATWLDVLGDRSLRPTSPAQITADQDNYATLNTSSLRLNTDASRNISGFADPANGKLLEIFNIGSFDITITNQDAASSVANRVITGNAGATLTILPNDSVSFRYDSPSTKWRKLD